MDKNDKKRVIGRGLEAILGDSQMDITSRNPEHVVGAISNIDLKNIEVNPFQPRKHFTDESLYELANSIKEHGVIQPITVRKMGYDKYQIVTGERRWRACQMVGLEKIPAYIIIADDEDMLIKGLVENIQREDLNPIEIAFSYKVLLEECNYTYEDISKKVSKDRSTISNYIRLLKLPSDIQQGLIDGKITMGHARAIINIDDVVVQRQIYEDIINNGMSVREVEEYVRNITSKDNLNKSAKNEKKDYLSKRYKSLGEVLSNKLNAKVRIKADILGKGEIVIKFNSDEELQKIFKILNKE